MIHHIILDLGGVILDVDYQRSVQAFNTFGITDFHALYSQQKQDLFFDRFERGELSAFEFRNQIRTYQPTLKDLDIDEAWNAMILQTPPQRIHFLQDLGKSYNLYLLSNTNEIHISCFTKYFNRNFGEGTFENLFKHIYLSSNLGMRKPEIAIFEHVLNENNLKADETLFIDDSIQHIEGAIKTGMHARLLPTGESIETYLVPLLHQLS